MDVSPLLVNLLGFVATSVAIVMWVPQARITWNNRNDALKLAGVSESTQWLSATSYLLWGIFGIASGSFWVTAPSIVSFPLSVATIVIIHRGRRLAPLTKSVSIIPASIPLSESTPTASIPVIEIAPVSILSTSDSDATGAAHPSTAHSTPAHSTPAHPATDAIHVLA